MLNMPNIQAFFIVPLGLILNVKVKTIVGDGNRVRHSSVEVVTKDGRRLNLILSNYELCEKARVVLKSYAFLDQSQMTPLQQFNEFFARNFYNALINVKQAVVGQPVAINPSQLLKELNDKCWAVYAEPIREFKRQGCNIIPFGALAHMNQGKAPS